jgi:DNA-binding CsgD family transcriptional regulator
MFRAVCEKLQKLIGIYSGIFVPADPKTGAMLPGGQEVFHISEGVVTLYLKHYATLDPLRPPYNDWCNKHLSIAARNTELVPEKNLLRTEFTCDFLIPVANVFYILASTIGAQGDIVGLAGFHRQKQASNFSDREMKIMNILLPHMAKAIQNRSLMNRFHQSKDMDGVIAIGKDGNPFCINHTAKQLLKGRPVKSIPDPGMSPNPIFFKSRSGTYRVRTLPLGRNGNGKVVLLERYPPEHRLQSKLEDSKLSRREMEIAVLTIQGYSNREIAEHSFICEQTVKDHLHTIFEKLEIRSRGELTAKVLGLRAGQLSL